MKKNFLKVVALSCATVLAFVGCSKEEGSDNGFNRGAEAALKISIENPTRIQSKALEAEDGSAIGDVTVLITNADNRIIDKYWYPSTTALSEAGTEGQIKTTTLANRVYIVGNISNSSTVEGGIFASTSTLAAAQGVLYNLTSISASNLPIYGASPSDLVFANVSDNMVASTSITMVLIPARIDVIVNNNMSDYAQADAVELDGVGVIYSAKQTYLIPNAGGFVPPYSAASGYFASGLMDYLGQAASEHTENTDLFAGWEANSSDTWGGSSGVIFEPAGFLSQFSKTFYVLPGEEKNLIVSVKSTFKSGNSAFAGNSKYYPIHFNTADVGNIVLQNGKRYVMSVNLNGDANDGTGGGGTDNPEIPVTSSYITVSIVPASWELVEITDPKEFE